jgi:DNA-binding transcriptional MerR regulator
MVIVMYTIGAFAQLGGVTVRMLRHYDSLGLLVPSFVDPVNGHRHYEAAQLSRLNRLVALRELGFSLGQVGQLLNEGIELAELRGMLRLRAAELQTRLLHDQQTLDRVRGRLRLIESETIMTITNVEVKTIAPQRVLFLQTTVAADDGEQHVEPLYEKVIEHMEAVGADRASPISWREREGDLVHIYAGYLAPTGEVPGLEVITLPAVSVASVVRRGAVEQIDEASQTLAQWAEVHGRTESIEAGRWRELYLETNDNDYSDWLIEIQLELMRGDRHGEAVRDRN